ncbi:MAG TPA: hypothetical protein VFK40_05450 [Nitrososphaeraceae archaeon]|nr:hypothetical protein [Nitrososphaeraceae archaeon]
MTKTVIGNDYLPEGYLGVLGTYNGVIIVYNDLRQIKGYCINFHTV